MSRDDRQRAGFAGRPLRLPPGPTGYQLVGALPRISRDWVAFLDALVKQYGDILYFRLFNIPICIVSHPEYIESVCTSHYTRFIKSKDYRALRRIFGNGLLVSEGESWHRQRRLVQPAFHRERIAAYGNLMVTYADRMLGTWQEGQTRDVHQEMMQVTLEIVTQALFGADVACEVEAVDASLRVLTKQFAGLSAYVIPDWVPTPGNLRIRKAVRRLDEVVSQIIRERRARSLDTGDLLSMLLHTQDDAGSGMSDQQGRDEVMTIFLAGHETTASALSWTSYLLAQSPEAEARLHAELDAVLGGRLPTAEDLNGLRYAEMVLKESMRLYPPAWLIGREATEEVQLGDYRVPAGTNIFMSQWLVHRDPRYFEQPQQFNPDRWTPERERLLPRFAYFPFGGGPRVCLGAAFAMMEAVLLLATISQRFRLRLVPGHTVLPLFSITLRPKHGVKVLLSRR